MTNISKEIAYLVKNWEKIPDSFKTNLAVSYYGSRQPLPGVPLEEHIVVLLLDRQKPSVEADYSFDEGRNNTPSSIHTTSRGEWWVQDCRSIRRYKSA